MPICFSQLVFPSSSATPSLFFSWIQKFPGSCVHFQFMLDTLPSFCDFALSFFALIFASSLVFPLKHTSRTTVVYLHIESQRCFLIHRHRLNSSLFPWFPFTGASSLCFLLGLELQSLNLLWLLFPITLNKVLVFRTLLCVPRFSGSY